MFSESLMLSTLLHCSRPLTCADDPSSLASKGTKAKLQHGVGSALADLQTLAKHPVYVLNVAGTAVYTGDSQTQLSKHLASVQAVCGVIRSFLLHCLALGIFITVVSVHRSCQCTS